MADLREQLQAALAETYTLERELGGGGMSRVFVAEERALGRSVVLKALPPELTAGLSVERFRREIQLVARLQHPHIVPVLTAGEAGGVPFFTMPFVEGRSLRERLRADGPLPAREAVRLLRHVAAALAYAHESGIVHRDIKPDNVLVSHDTAMVTDFGVAKALSSALEQMAHPAGESGTLTALGTSLGTPAYMAPEQAAGDPATDHRADIYSFGVLAYELLAGQPPFTGRPPHALIVAHLTERPEPLDQRRPDLPAGLVELVHACLEKDPDRRPQSAAVLVQALDDLPVTGSSSGAREAVARPAAASGAGGGGGGAGGGEDSLADAARSRPWRMAAAAAAALVLLAGAAFWMLRDRADGPATARSAQAAPATSLAVLPFVNVGGDPSDEYFSDGMSDELIDALSRVPGLRVASRTSAFAYKGKSADARDIARELNVGSLLEGRVRRDGQRLRVSAQLTNAEGFAIWSETYEREMADVFAVQNEIANAITRALQVQLAGGADAPAGPRRGTTDLAAYDLYLRGRYFFHQRGSTALRQAADYFEQAIARDPEYAQAHAGLADAAALLPIYGDTPADSAYRIARRAAERAVALDSSLAEAHTTLGLVLKSVGEWDASERAFRRALALDPRYSSAHQWLGEVLLITGRVPEAIAALRRAEELDPLSPVVAAELAYTLGLAGRAEEARAAGQRGVELGPTLWTTHAFLGLAHLFGGRTAEGVRELETAVRLDSNVTPVVGALAYAYGVAGDTTRAQALLARLERQGAAPGGSAIAVAMAHLGLGNRDEALTWLERAVERRDSWLYAMSVNSALFDPVRADPRFAAVVRRMGLDVGVMTAAGAGRER